MNTDFPAPLFPQQSMTQWCVNMLGDVSIGTREDGGTASFNALSEIFFTLGIFFDLYYYTCKKVKFILQIITGSSKKGIGVLVTILILTKDVLGGAL
tara:strand:+ start:203 stop:493 length:291 start_codon:yes stop_codon:yes gene_type:complete